MDENADLVNRVKKADIPKKSIYRLSIYYRCLHTFQESGQKTVSSSALAEVAGVKPAQLRKDLTHFGQFGIRGLGYPVDGLIATIHVALGRDLLQPVILIGAGNLGSALLRYQGFQKEGFDVIAVFDANPESARARQLELPVHGMDEMEAFTAENEVKLAILCVPVEVAQSVCDLALKSGIKGILNFSPTLLSVPDTVTVNNVDLALELEHLGFFVK